MSCRYTSKLVFQSVSKETQTSRLGRVRTVSLLGSFYFNGYIYISVDKGNVSRLKRSQLLGRLN